MHWHSIQASDLLMDRRFTAIPSIVSSSFCHFVLQARAKIVFRPFHHGMVEEWLIREIWEGARRGLFHSKDTWGCAALKGILLQTSGLARVYFLAILVQISLGKGMLLANLVKEMSEFGNSCKKPNFKKVLVQRIWQVL